MNTNHKQCVISVYVIHVCELCLYLYFLPDLHMTLPVVYCVYVCHLSSHLPSLVQCIYWSMKDSNQGVRNAALFALGQFSEHFQVHIAPLTVCRQPLIPCPFFHSLKSLSSVQTCYPLYFNSWSSYSPVLE